MAKVRRVIRKRQTETPFFDEKQWPVNLALFVLGGFLVGAAAGYQRFDDPRWWCNAWISVVSVPLLIGGLILALRRVNSRTIRRAMQFATILSLTIHLLFIIATMELTVFSRTQRETSRPRELTRRVVQVPDVNPFQPNERDFERPVETETPEPDPQPLERQVPEQEIEQAQPQPAPVPEPQPTNQPNVTRRESAETPTPRRSDNPSQLARAADSSVPAATQAMPLAEATRPSSSDAALAPAASAVARRATQAPASTASTMAEPQTQQPQAAQVARREAPATARPENAPAATMPRATPAAAETPRAQVAADAPAATARQTAESALAPAATVMTRQRTASPAVAQSTPEPSPTTPDEPSPTTQRREQPSPAQPTIASAPTPVPNQRTRATTRPDARTVAETATPAPAAASAAPTPAAAQPADTSVARAAPRSPSMERPSAEPAPSPTPAPTAVADSSAARAASSDSAPGTRVQTAQSAPQRTASTASATPTATADAVASAQRAPESAPLAAASSALQRQSTASPQTARAAGEPTTPGSRQPDPGAVASQRRSRSQEAPTTAESPGAIARRRVDQALPNAVAATSDSAVSASPAASAESALRPSLSAMSRQPTSSPGAAASRPSAEAPTASSEAQIAQSRPDRAAPADAPSLSPLVRAAETPARTRAAGDLASPEAVDHPAVAVSAQPQTSPTTPEAAPTALSRSTAGRAGIGRTSNLDRNDPAADSPAQVASASAQRRESTRADAAGPELSASEPATIARSIAGAREPSSVLRAQDVELATRAGEAEPSLVDASSSAALVRSRSDAAEGATTANQGGAEIDNGPTRLVSNQGADRGGGGGQPELNPDLAAEAVVRRSQGGDTSMSLAVAEVAPLATSPEAEGGGMPQLAAAASSDVARRQDAGEQAADSAGPSAASLTGPAEEANAADLVADAMLRRATSPDQVGEAGGAAGGPEGEEEDEEERARRLAQLRAGGAPELAVAGPVELPDAPAEQAGIGDALAAADNAPSRAASAGVAGESSAMADAPSGAGESGATAASAARAAGAEAAPQAIAMAAAPTARAATGGAQIDTAAPVALADAGTTGQESGTPSPDAALAAATSGVGRGVANSGAQVAGADGSAPESGAEVAGQVAVARAEAADSAPGIAMIGGGTGAPLVRSTGPALQLSVEAEQIEVAGLAESSGAPAGSPLAAQGTQVARMTTGAPTGDSLAAAGAAGEPSQGMALPPGAPGRRAQGQGGAAPLTGAELAAAAPGRQAPTAAALALSQTASPSELAFAAELSGTDLAALASASLGPSGPMSASAGLAADVLAPDGPAGLAGEIGGTPGTQSRRAREDSVELATRTSRYVREQTGGTPDANTSVVVATEPFRRRTDRTGSGTPGSLGRPGPETERAIESGLVFLAKQQLADGSWSLKGFNGEAVKYSSDTAATGLCVLAFQGAGYNHREFKYADVVRSGLDYLIKNQDDNGCLFVTADEYSNQYTRLYTHGIAAIALCEAYGMTQDPDLKAPAQRALDYIVQCQDSQRGGWRYQPGVSSDTSATGWMMMALRSGELAGLEVPRNAYLRIEEWLKSAQAPDAPFKYVYDPFANENDAVLVLGRSASKSMTAVGLLARMYVDPAWGRKNPQLQRGADYLVQPENLPAFGVEREGPFDKKRDTYYWYYATQVLAHVGGEHWERWHSRLHPLLVDSQVKTGPLAGSWDPFRPVPDRWAFAAGRLYVTTMNLLSLEVNYRLLPLYEETAK